MSMETSIIVVGCLALVHFIYEGIVAPTIRMKLRYQLFALRDDLRRLKHEKGESISDEVFSLLQGSLNNAIVLLPKTNFALLSRVRTAYSRDIGLRARVDKEIETIRQYPVQEIRDIYEKISGIFGGILATNTAGLLVYLIPIVAILLYVTTCLKQIKRIVTQILLLPEQERSKIEPFVIA